MSYEEEIKGLKESARRSKAKSAEMSAAGHPDLADLFERQAAKSLRRADKARELRNAS
jgi:hypothetical protein